MDVITSVRHLESMTPSELFVHELARLVWLLVYRPGYLDEQKSVLRSLRGVARDRDFRVVQSDLAASVADGSTQVPPPDGHAWKAELSTRMAFHSVRSIDTTAGATAGDLLGLARALASAEASDEPGAAFDAQFVALASRSLSVQLGRHGFSRAPTPVYAMRAYGSSIAEANAKPSIVQNELMPATHVDDVIIRLRGDLGPHEAPVLFDEITRILEDNARDGAWPALIDLASKVLEREATITHPDVKRGVSIVFKRLAKPGILRGVAQLLPRNRDLRSPVHAFLLRQGDRAVDVLIELLVGADSSGDRRAYRDALRQIPGATGPLQQLLEDHRWYVARNAAELLGEMHAVEADQALIDLLKHRDARVRQAATLSLIKLGTPRAVHTILRALADPDAAVRLKAAHGLGRVTHPGVVPGLLSALDSETDEATVHAILLALAHHPAETALQRIVQESTPGSLLKRRPSYRRVAATQALGEARNEVARNALRDLAKDRDRGVRELAERLLRDGASR